jgi:hypothetical protein
MRPQAGVYPKEKPRTTESVGEVAVYDSLRSRCPRGWYAWHSLRLMDRDGVFGEGDFVVADPERGVLVLEVKGGRIEQRDGRWFQNSRPMSRDPRDQGYEFARKLLSRLDSLRCAPPGCAVATCFPDVVFEQPPDQDDLSQTTIGGQDLPWLDERLNALIRRVIPKPKRSRGMWIERLHELWGQTWIPSMRLGRRAQLEEQERTKLDERQIRILDMLEQAPRLLVEGGAGTGKTLIAREAARRFAARGAHVLLLCFTNALAEWLRRTVDKADVDVWSVGKLALELARRSGMSAEEPASAEEWDKVILSAAAEGLQKSKAAWDVVILDEAQDLSDVDWLLVAEIASEKRFWVFRDSAQHFWKDRQLPKEVLALTPIRLLEGHRCSAGIEALAECYREGKVSEAGAEKVRRAIEDGTLRIVGCPNESSILDRIAREVEKLRSAGFAKGDIAIISVRGQQASKTFRLERIGAYRLVNADDPDAGDEIIDDTFLRFKGLERPAVIVTDLNLISDRRELRMYVAITRAQSALRIVAPNDAILKDPILARFAS